MGSIIRVESILPLLAVSVLGTVLEKKKETTYWDIRASDACLAHALAI